MTTIRNASGAARLAVGLLAVLLLAMNALGWLLVVRGLQTESDILRDGLESSARLMVGTLPRDAVFFLDVSYDPTERTTDFRVLGVYRGLPTTVALEEAFRDLALSESSVSDVELLTVDGLTILDGEGLKVVGTPSYLSEVDAESLAAAAAGEVAVTPFDGERRTRRVYHPVRGFEGEVIAILRLESLPRARGGLAAMATRLVWAAAGTSALIVVLWWMLLLLVRRAEAAERRALEGIRLQALGTATAGIAHEIRNPLGILLLTVEELRSQVRHLPEGDARNDLEDGLASLKDEIERLTRLTRQFLELARNEPEAPSGSCDVVAIVEDVAAQLRKELASDGGAALDVVVADRPLPAGIDPDRLRQVVLNILYNARDAVVGQSGGQIRVEVRRAGAMVEVLVRDNGRGIDDATLARVFDPFFTTRADGTGLGLPISRRSVEVAGGSLELTSRVGTGTQVVIRLPLASEPA